MSKSVVHLDLHPVAKNGKALDEALEELIASSVEKGVKKAEIIPGKGSGQLMKRVKKFLDRKEIKAQYKRVVVDQNNHGRLFVYFK